MAIISGSVGANSSKYSYWIDWSESSVDINNNTSVVSATVYVQKVSNYNAEGSSSNTLTIDGTTFTASPYVDMNPETGAIALVSGSKTITHNSDGSKSISISASSSLPAGGGFGPSSGSASATVSLTNIPREATISNSVNFTVGNNIPLTISNAGNLWVRAELYVISTLIKTQDLGQVTSDTLTLNSTNNDAIYALMPSATSASMYVRLKTYNSGSYTTQIGSNKDKSGTVSIDTALNKPTFTSYTVANVDKTIDVVDEYGNTLTSQSTATLLGSSTRMIKGYSKVRGTITVANKAVAQNSATMSSYRFATTLQYADAAFSSGSDVEIDLDNVVLNDFTMTAIDSRALSTAVSNSLSLMAEYTPLSLFNMSLTRDNNVDALTKLAFQGTLWNKYFGSNSSTPTGVQNTLTMDYRWRKGSRSAFQVLDGTCTISIATPAVVSKTAHGLTTGDIVYLTTTGALPTGLSSNTYYWVIYKDADSFYLATSLANAQAGTKINTSGSQSGTHTLRVDGKWTTITPSVDGSGNITFDDYIDGDLGSSGFSIDRSFVIEVRGYDKLSQAIIRSTLSVGTPLIDLTQDGVSIQGKYDSGEGGALQINGIAIQKFVGNLLYPVGSLYFNATDSTNPATLLGFGTWSAFGAGRVPVGYNSGDSDFNASEKTGGAKTVAITTSEMPSHPHTVYGIDAPSGSGAGYLALQTDGNLVWYRGNGTNWSSGGGSGGSRAGMTIGGDRSNSTSSAGSGNAHNNLQPYITVYIWKRTA